MSVPSHVTAVAHKRPWQFCQKCMWQVTPIHTFLTQLSRSKLTMLSRHSAGTYQGKRAHTRLVRKHSATDSPLSHCGPILAFKKKVELLCASRSPVSKKSAGGKSIVKNFPQKSSQARKKPPPSLVFAEVTSEKTAYHQRHL